MRREGGREGGAERREGEKKDIPDHNMSCFFIQNDRKGGGGVRGWQNPGLS
jgi:hypothetical protein